jgi:threonine dehydratase
MDLNNQILEAASKIDSFTRETTFCRSEYFSRQLKGQVYFKLENQQVTGSFKVRGALNKILSLTESEKQRGVLSASTGNHGAAVAHASREADINCNIYVPKGSSEAKLSNIRILGASITVFGDDCVEAEAKARELSYLNEVSYVSPYNDVKVMAGQGTLGVEIKTQVDELDAIIISVGGGGLMAGTASYLRSVWPKIKIIGCSPENSAVMIHSMEAGKILELESLPTLSDGTAGGVEDDSITFPICCDLINETVLLSEQEIKEAMILYMQYEHQLIEGAAGTAVAALLKMKDQLKGKRVGVVICGGNIALDTLREVID